MDRLRDRIRIEPAAVSNYLAWIRTLLATERTLKAEVRTSVALIAFGFTIVQFFDRLQDMSKTGRAVPPVTSRDLGLALIAAGVISALISMWQYRRLVSRLWTVDLSANPGMDERPQWTPTLAVLAVVCLIGVFAFVSVLLHLS